LHLTAAARRLFGFDVLPAAAAGERSRSATRGAQAAADAADCQIGGAVDRVLTPVACGLAGAVLLAALGAMWGGAVRVLAYLRGPTVPDATLREALRRGVRGGTRFLGAVGGVLGVLIGVIEPSADDAAEALAASVGTVGLIMLVIVGMIGVPATALVWLALRARRGSHPAAAGSPSRGRPDPVRPAQLVGQNCALCGERISNELDARYCPTCGSPVHDRCARTGASTGCPECGATPKAE
jgi:hypothetical protein